MRASLPMSMRMYRCFPNARRALFSLALSAPPDLEDRIRASCRRSANRHRSDPEFAFLRFQHPCSLQYSFTLALEDGGTTRIGYGSESAAALMPLPSLAAWVGKSVKRSSHAV